MNRFPDQVHAAELPGGRFAWLEAGAADAPVALCVHGFPDHPRTFEPLLEPLLQAGYRVVAPWLRGYLPSVVHGPYDAPRLGTDLVELAAVVSPERPLLLLGHDWGAVASWHAAARSPGRIRALVALSVPHPRAFLLNVPRHPRQLLRSWYIGLFQLPLLPEALLRARDGLAVAQLFRSSSVPKGRVPAYLPELVECLRRSLPGPLGPYRALRRGHFAAGELKVRVPTLFLTGALDPSVGPEMRMGQKRWVEATYAGHVLEGAGHFLHHDRPAEVAAQILEFAGGGSG